MSKLLFTLVAVTLLGCVAEGNAFLILGKIQPGDKLLHYEEIHEPRQEQFQTIQKKVDFPLPGKTNNATIHHIKAVSQNLIGRGGHAVLLSGGIDQKFASIGFQSLKGEGLNFILEIYGK